MPGDDLEERVSALDDQVRDAAAARVLAGAADRDVTEFHTELRDFRQATTASFNAMREDFVDLREHVDRGFTEVRGKLDAAAGGQQRIADLIQTLIDQER
jgi:hypothetical protein